MEPRNIGPDKTGCLLLTVLSMTVAAGCGQPSDDVSLRRGSTRTALVASVPPQEGQAFLVGVFAPSRTEAQSLRNAVQQAAQSNHLVLDEQLLDADRAAQSVQLDRWQGKRVDALLVCAFPPVNMPPLLRDAADRQIPVLMAEWEEFKTVAPLVVPSPASAVSKPTAKKPAIQAILPDITLSAKPGQDKRLATLTLFHNGKTTRQRIYVTLPELGERAVAILSAFLRGEKVKPVQKF